MQNKIELFSDSFRDLLTKMQKNHPECEIINQLVEADKLTHAYNALVSIREIDNYDLVYPLIEKRINEIITDEARMISCRHESFELSYLPKGKEPEYASDGVWSRSNRQTAKPARLIQKLLVQKFTCKEFEDFSNYFRSEITHSGEFVILSGSDITKYYNRVNYEEESGTLGNSCMRYDSCESYFGVYEDNAKMLVIMKGEKILGRALLWEMSDGTTLMDRVYTAYDYLYSTFITYAEEHKWWHRDDNSLLNDGDYQYWLTPDDNYQMATSREFQISLNKRYDEFPYMDSFRYYDYEANLLSTIPIRDCSYLSNTDGSWREQYPWVCDSCGTTYYSNYDDETPDEIFYSDYEDRYLCEDCAIWCEYIESYVSRYCDMVNLSIEKLDDTPVPRTYIEDRGSDFIEIDGHYFEDGSDLIGEDEDGTLFIKEVL